MQATAPAQQTGLKATIVFQKNWEAMHKVCETCNGAGHVEDISCSWCGNGETKITPDTKHLKGSGRHWRYIVNRGSSRSSKTYTLIDCFDLTAREESNERLTVWRSTKTDCKKTVLVDVLKHLRTTNRYLGLEFNKTESIFRYPTGSTFEIHGTDDEETVHGLTCDYAWFNEPYQVSRETFDQIDQRTSKFIFIDYNPKKGHWVEDVLKDKRTILITSTFKDNPFCPAESRNKILSYQPVEYCELVLTKQMTAQEAREYNLLENPADLPVKYLKELTRCRENEAKRSASSFNWCVYGLGTKAEKPNRIFRWEECSVEDYLKINVPMVYVGNDWGKVDPWAIAEVKYYDGCLYVREKNYSSENEIRSKLTHTELAQVNQDDEGIVIWTFERLGIPKSVTIVADSNRPLKIAMLRRHGWDCHGPNKPKGSIVDGINLLDNLTVYYTSDSPNIKYEQENYSRKVDTNGMVLEEPEDVDNHHMDAIRYVALYLQAQDIIRRV